MSEWTDFNECRAALLEARAKLAFIHGFAAQAAEDTMVYKNDELARRHFTLIAEKSARKETV